LLVACWVAVDGHLVVLGGWCEVCAVNHILLACYPTCNVATSCSSNVQYVCAMRMLLHSLHLQPTGTGLISSDPTPSAILKFDHLADSKTSSEFQITCILQLASSGWPSIPVLAGMWDATLSSRRCHKSDRSIIREPD